HRLGGQLLAGDDLGRGEDLAIGDAGGAVELALVVDEDLGHKPVDLVPGRGDLGGDDVLAEHLDDGGEEVVVDDGVLIFHDPQGYVLVTDAGEHLHRVRGA